jgi:hypothetical protein
VTLWVCRAPRALRLPAVPSSWSLSGRCRPSGEGRELGEPPSAGGECLDPWPGSLDPRVAVAGMAGQALGEGALADRPQRSWLLTQLGAETDLAGIETSFLCLRSGPRGRLGLPGRTPRTAPRRPPTSTAHQRRSRLAVPGRLWKALSSQGRGVGHKRARCEQSSRPCGGRVRIHTLPPFRILVPALSD